MDNFFSELKRRHVYRVAAAYAVVGWVLIQLVNNVAPALRLPEWAPTLVIVLLLVGFPITLLIAWMRELTPADGEAARAATGKLDWVLIGALVTVLAAMSYQQLASPRTTVTTNAQAGVEAVRTAANSPAGAISVAVLPFVNLSSDKEQEFFSDGMTEEITSALAKIQNLRVVGRTSAFQFKGENKDLTAIGQALHATHLIEGSVRKEGARVRITAQLVQADNGVSLWTDSYDRELTSVFATQEDIAQAIAGALRVPLGLQPGETLVSDRTTDLDSYQQYLRAKALYRARGPNVAQAIAILENVVVRDPAFAPAWGLLAQAYVFVPNSGDSPVIVQSAFERVEKAAQQAIRLDSRNTNGHAALADIQQRRGNWAAAEDLYRQILALDPNEPDVLTPYRALLGNVGRVKEHISVSQKLRTLEPLDPAYSIDLAGHLQMIGQYEASIPILEAVSVAGVLDDLRHRWLAQAYAGLGQYAKAADTILAIKDGYSRRSIEDAARLLRAAPAKAAEPLPDLEVRLSFVYVHVGAADRYLQILEREVEAHYISQISNLWRPAYAPTRKTERFKALMRNAGMVEYWRARGWPDLCRPVGTDDFVCD